MTKKKEEKVVEADLTGEEAKVTTVGKGPDEPDKTLQDDRNEETSLAEDFIEDLTGYLEMNGVDEPAKFIQANKLDFNSRIDVVKIHDDGFMVTKLRFREFKKGFVRAREAQK